VSALMGRAHRAGHGRGEGGRPPLPPTPSGEAREGVKRGRVGLGPSVYVRPRDCGHAARMRDRRVTLPGSVTAGRVRQRDRTRGHGAAA
jgi:hypothetical protein